MKQKLTNHIKAGYSGLYLISHETQRVEAEVAAVAKAMDFDLHVWSITKGVAHMKPGKAPVIADGTDDALKALDHFEHLSEKSILLMRDFHFFTGDPQPFLIARIKECLLAGKSSNKVLIILGCQLKLVPELEKELTVIEFKLPDRAALLHVAEGIIKSANEDPKRTQKLELNGNTDSLLDAASGLTTTEAEDAFAMSLVETGDLTATVVARVKAATIKKGGILEFIDSGVDMSAIGGMEGATGWMEKRKAAFTEKAREYGLPTPKGVLLVGPPGCGKTLFGKCISNSLGIPLLKLDAGRLFGSMVGQSEQNIRAVIQTVEAVAPVVLLIDEIEKGFEGSKSSGQTDGGTSARVLGTFLTWMQDKTAPVFVVATANNVAQLPPEMLRKGRFDELFFIDLPDHSERQAIWKIQIAKKGRKPSKFNIEKLSDITEDWTGAEIEGLFTEALFAAFDEDREPDTELIQSLAKDTVPLSKTMAAQIDAIRQWAAGKARRATIPKAQTAKSTARKLA